MSCGPSSNQRTHHTQDTLTAQVIRIETRPQPINNRGRFRRAKPREKLSFLFRQHESRGSRPCVGRTAFVLPRSEAAQQESDNRVEVGFQGGVVPFGGMGGVVEAGSGL